MTNHSDVTIVGAGPTGLALANELAVAGIDCRIVERRLEGSNITRAFAVHARTLELLDARGLAEKVVRRGVQLSEVRGVPGATLDLSELPSRYPMLLIAPQSATEAVLQASAERLGVNIERGAEVIGVEQDPTRCGFGSRPATANGCEAPAIRGALAEFADRVLVAEHDRVDAPDVILVRPDAYVAWAEDHHVHDDGLDAALRRWCGAPRATATPGAVPAPEVMSTAPGAVVNHGIHPERSHR